MLPRKKKREDCMIGNHKLYARLLGTSALAAMLGAAAPAWAQSAGSGAQSTASDTPAAQSETAGAESGPEVVVTGSSIRGVPPTGSNLIRVSRDDIKLIGAATTP